MKATPLSRPYWQNYDDVASVSQNSSPTVCIIAGVNFSSMHCKNTPKTATKRTAYETALFPRSNRSRSLVSGSIITGLTNADMDEASQKRGKFMAKKLDFNGDGIIDKTKFYGRIVTMFEKMDNNGDGSLDKKKSTR